MLLHQLVHHDLAPDTNRLANMASDKDKDKKIKEEIKKEGDSKDAEIKPGGIDKIQEKIDKKKP